MSELYSRSDIALALEVVTDLTEVINTELERRGLLVRTITQESGLPLSVIYKLRRGRGFTSKTLITLLTWLSESMNKE